MPENTTKPVEKEVAKPTVKFTASINGYSVDIYSRIQTRGRSIGKEVLSPDVDKIDDKNLFSLFSVSEFLEFIRGALKKLGSDVTEETVTRDSDGKKIVSVDQAKWTSFFFEKVSAVSESLRGLKARKDTIWNELMAITPATPDAMIEFTKNPALMAQFAELSAQIRAISDEIEEKSN